MKKVSTILRYVIAAIIIFAILSYCQELNDYYSKPNAEEIFEAIYHLMHLNNPDKFPAFI